MEDEYITNVNTEDLGDEGLLEKLKKAESELTTVKTELEEKSKLCLEQKHKLDDINQENTKLQGQIDNLNDLLKFYEEAEKPEEGDSEDKKRIKELEIKITNIEEKIKENEEKMKEYEEKIIIKDNEIEVIKKDLDEQKKNRRKKYRIVK